MAPAFAPVQQLPSDLLLPADLFASISTLKKQGGWFSGTSMGVPCGVDALDALASNRQPSWSSIPNREVFALIAEMSGSLTEAQLAPNNGTRGWAKAVLAPVC